MNPKTLPMTFSNMRSPGMVFLLLGIVVVWVYVFWFVLQQKNGLFDDAYITLHISNNIIEQGTARYFPITESRALLSSSPLRLLVLLPATGVSRLLVDPRSVEAARLTFLFSGIITSLLFLPFYRRARSQWGLGFLIAGILALCSETALQMEGLLLFWSFFTLACPQSKIHLTRKPVSMGFLLGLLLLSRPEYGLPALFVGAVWFWGWPGDRANRWGNLAHFALPVLLLGLVWVVLMLSLGVYPIPTTYISKVLTGEVDLFGPSFGNLLAFKLRTYLMAGLPLADWGVWVVLGLTGLAIGLGSMVHRIGLLILVVIGLSLLDAGGNYRWYLENLIIVMLALISGCFQIQYPDRGKRTLYLLSRSWLVFIIILFLASNWSPADRLGVWGLRESASRGTGYRNIGHACSGGGLFSFPGVKPSYLVMMEIGMVSYFGGGQAWIFDRGGLAQPGFFPNAQDHVLSRFYPQSLLASPEEELTLLNRRLGRAQNWPPIWKAWGQPDTEAGKHNCAIYLAEKAICLQPIKTQ